MLRGAPAKDGDRPKIVGEWRVSDAELLEQMGASASPLWSFPPGLLPLIASFVGVPVATAEQLERAYNADPGHGISVCIRFGPFQIRLVVAAQDNDELSCSSRLGIATQLRPGVPPTDVAARIRAAARSRQSKWFGVLCDFSDNRDGTSLHDAAMLHALLLPPQSVLHNTADQPWVRGIADAPDRADSHTGVPEFASVCVGEWTDSWGFKTDRPVASKLRTAFDAPIPAVAAVTGTSAAAGDPTALAARLPSLGEARRGNCMRYAALWANAFPTSAYFDEPHAPITTADILSANLKLASMVERDLVPATERSFVGGLPDAKCTTKESCVVDATTWPVCINSADALCEGLHNLFRGREAADGSGDFVRAYLVAQLPIASRASGKRAWWPSSEAALYRAFTQVLQCAVDMGVELVGRNGVALRAFCGRALPELAVDDDLVRALVSGLNFEWRRPHERSRAKAAPVM